MKEVARGMSSRPLSKHPTRRSSSHACVHEAFSDTSESQLQTGSGESGVGVAPAKLPGEGPKLPGELQGRKAHSAIEVLSIAPR